VFEHGHRRAGRKQGRTKPGRESQDRPVARGPASVSRQARTHDPQATDQGREEGGERGAKPVGWDLAFDEPCRESQPGEPGEERDRERDDPQQPAKGFFTRAAAAVKTAVQSRPAATAARKKKR
jgi:hypothetical protein